MPVRSRKLWQAHTQQLPPGKPVGRLPGGAGVCSEDTQLRRAGVLHAYPP
jgi:hypothetical protein